MHVTNVLHGQEDEDPAQSHDKLPPLEVWCPCLTEQVLQLLVDRIVAGEIQGRQLQYRTVTRVGSRGIPKQGLHLHKRAGLRWLEMRQ